MNLHPVVPVSSSPCGTGYFPDNSVDKAGIAVVVVVGIISEAFTGDSFPCTLNPFDTEPGHEQELKQ